MTALEVLNDAGIASSMVGWLDARNCAPLLSVSKDMALLSYGWYEMARLLAMFDREAFLVTQEDLVRMMRSLIGTANISTEELLLNMTDVA